MSVSTALQKQLKVPLFMSFPFASSNLTTAKPLSNMFSLG